MDEKQMALEQIKAIHEVFYSGDRLTGSPRGLYVTGVTTVLIGIAMAAAKLQEIGWIGNRVTAPLMILALVAAVVLNTRSRHSSEELAKMEASHSMLHPMIKQSFGISRALLLGGFGLTVVWWMHLDRVMAIWMIILGVIANLWGRLVHKYVERFSYVLIVGGVLLAGLGEFGFLENTVLTVAMFYWGFWSLAMGRLVQKYQRS